MVDLINILIFTVGYINLRISIVYYINICVLRPDFIGLIHMSLQNLFFLFWMLYDFYLVSVFILAFLMYNNIAFNLMIVHLALNVMSFDLKFLLTFDTIIFRIKIILGDLNASISCDDIEFILAA